MGWVLSKFKLILGKGSLRFPVDGNIRFFWTGRARFTVQGEEIAGNWEEERSDVVLLLILFCKTLLKLVLAKITV